jgi:hypothetical protein
VAQKTPRLKIPQQDKKMKLTQHTFSVSMLALVVTASHAFASDTVSANMSEPAYNPATVVDVRGIVTGVRQVSAGSPLAGVHLTVQSKTGTFDVYVAPPDFLKFLKTSFKVGEQIDIVGSKVKFENADVLLTRQVDDGYAMITLRDPDGTTEWQSWGKEVDPTAAQ